MKGIKQSLAQVVELMGIPGGHWSRLDDVWRGHGGLEDDCASGKDGDERAHLDSLHQLLENVLRRVFSGDERAQLDSLQQRLEEVLRQGFAGGDCTLGVSPRDSVSAT